MSSTSYGLAPQGVYASFQGEGVMVGVPMVFVRLAGCSVRCEWCDTDYSFKVRVDLTTLRKRIEAESRLGSARWAWITGGEPLERDLVPLAVAVRESGLQVALATSGHRPVPPQLRPLVDWLSVSPHDPSSWVQEEGDELKLVPGLAGFSLADFESRLDGVEFPNRFAQPCRGHPETRQECMDFVRSHPGFRLGFQAQELWEVD